MICERNCDDMHACVVLRAWCNLIYCPAIVVIHDRSGHCLERSDVERAVDDRVTVAREVRHCVVTARFVVVSVGDHCPKLST